MSLRSQESLSPRRVRWLLYAEHPRRRARQFLADVAVLVWTAVVVSAAITLHATVLALQEPGRRLTGAGEGVRDTFASASGTASGVPFVGDDLANALGGGTRAGDALAAAGTQEVAAVDSLATGLAWLVVLLGVLPVLLVWLTLRARWAVAAGAVLAVRDGVRDADLLALRALSHTSPARLARTVPGAAAGWRRGDVRILARLADLELARLGLRGPSVVHGPGAGTDRAPDPETHPETHPEADPEEGWDDTPPPPDPSIGRTS